MPYPYHTPLSTKGLRQETFSMSILIYLDQLLFSAQSTSIQLVLEFSYSQEELLAQYIIVCLSDHYCKSIFKDLKVSENLLLVGHDLKQKDYFQLAVNPGEASGLLFQRVRETIYGKDLQRLKQLQLSKKLTISKQKEIKKAISQLDAESYKDRKAGRIFLSNNLDDAYASLVIARMVTQSIETRENCKEILMAAARRDKSQVIGKPNLQQVSSRTNTAFACGMASMPVESRVFVSQLAG